jgi:hypothetical protein
MRNHVQAAVEMFLSHFAERDSSPVDSNNTSDAGLPASITR